jgi:hypothetical protein
VDGEEVVDLTVAFENFDDALKVIGERSYILDDRNHELLQGCDFARNCIKASRPDCVRIARSSSLACLPLALIERHSAIDLLGGIACLDIGHPVARIAVWNC